MTNLRLLLPLLIIFIKDVISQYELILNQPMGLLFDTTLKETGLYNTGDGLFSSVGLFDDAKLAYYRSSTNNKYRFKLVYDETIVITWEQSSFLTSGTITGYEFIDATVTETVTGCGKFIGLGLSDNTNAYLDGTGQSNCWWNSCGM